MKVKGAIFLADILIQAHAFHAFFYKGNPKRLVSRGNMQMSKL